MAHDHSHHHHHEGFSNKRRLGLVVFLNCLITIAEYIGGILSGSLALLSDAGHNFSDVLSLILGYAGERVSEVKPDKKYSFGLKRFEVLIALVNALSLVVIAIYIVHEAIERYMHPQAVDPHIMLPIAVIGLLGNLFSILVLNKSKGSSLNIRAAFLHLLYDAISSLAVIVTGIVLLFYNLLILDLVISIIIVFMIIWSSVDILKESLRIFLQGTPRDIDSDDVYRRILALNSVESLHGLHIWSVSSSEVFLSCHICLNREKEGLRSDEVIADVNKMLEEHFGISHTALQVERNSTCSVDGDCCR